MGDPTTTILLPQIDSWLDPFAALEEPLLLQLRPLPDVDPDEQWQLPATLYGDAVYEAWSRIVDAIPAALRERAWAKTYDPLPGELTLLAPDGRYEHAPLYAATVAKTDIDRLAGLLDHLRRAAKGDSDTGDLDEILRLTASHRSEHQQQVSVEDVVQSVAAVLAVLQQRPDADTELLLAVVEPAEPGARITLTDEQEAAYQRVIDRFIAATATSRHDAETTRFTV
ncbi:hypothetical protein [Kitasatospora cathayae]|uniref:Uncharacterized protein n=1 Tax=Kitasatospora cathayae TaxID=3004092 RepID=A0ABY7QH92_9ACTN|nr:hypothetical protein [Kitasatospora sp. HUAS 3-15]WBP92208.1 hypothetical protein O1G21_41100 [Kitasatospora sp. HUAS 3-15]